MVFADLDAAVSRIAETMPLGTRDRGLRSQPCAAQPQVVHRVIEQHAALHGDTIALMDGDRALTWRELNGRANAVARQLMAAGLRRGDVAQVEMPVCADLGIVLLAVLKAGGCYAWKPGSAVEPACVLILDGTQGERSAVVHVGTVLSGAFRPSPNLPVMVRGTDAACLLQHDHGAPALVPHASLAALRQTAAPAAAAWGGDPGAFDLWILLMAGLSVSTLAPQYATAAAWPRTPGAS